MPSIKTFQWKRRMTQIAFLIFLGEFSFYGIFRCPFAVPYVSCGNCPVIQCPGRKLWLGFWIVLPVSAIIFGRFFCGWACPGGFVSELLGKLSLARGKMKGALEKVVSSGKYLVIAGSLVVFLLGLGLAILIPGFWCRYLCPTGGILEAFRRFSLFKYFKTKDCNDCDKCRKLCDLETRPSEINCTNCGACSNICPVDAIKVGWKAKGKMDDRYRR
ncbi:MAG: 4Fe-4S binding protein [Deltaproteobacteria bacterium]|nr:4Fe-4S binding protein [Deltaproteobacteria bacterium]